MSSCTANPQLQILSIPMLSCGFKSGLKLSLVPLLVKDNRSISHARGTTRGVHAMCAAGWHAYKGAKSGSSTGEPVSSRSCRPGPILWLPPRLPCTAHRGYALSLPSISNPNYPLEASEPLRFASLTWYTLPLLNSSVLLVNRAARLL